MRYILFILLLLALPIVSALRFSEIMYDPDGNDNNREFIEIEEAPDLTGWIVADMVSNDTLIPLQLNESSDYAIIVEEGFNYSGLPCSVYSAGATIGNNLNNGNDSLIIYDAYGKFFQATNYTDVFGSNNGFSLINLDGLWSEGAVPGGTPCFPDPINVTINVTTNSTNITNATTNVTINMTTNVTINVTINSTTNITVNVSIHDISLAVVLPSTIYAGVLYDSLFRVRDERHVPGETNALNVTVRYFIMSDDWVTLNDTFTVVINYYSSMNTGSIMLKRTGNYTLCGTIIEVNDHGNTIPDDNATNDAICAPFAVLDPFAEPCNVSLTIEFSDAKLFYEAGQRTQFRNNVIRHDNRSSLPPFIIIYSVEDLFGNVLSVKTTENDGVKSYTPKIDSEFGVFIIKSRFAMLACNNTNIAGDEKTVVVRGEEKNAEEDSALKIDDLNEPKSGYKAGDEIRVSLSAYRGATGKYSVKLWVENDNRKKVSSVTSFNARDPFTAYDILLPIRLHEGIPAGEYYVVVEGLDERDSLEVAISAKGKAKNTTMKNTTAAVNATGGFAIYSFYTRNKKPAALINLYSTIKGKGGVTIDLVGLADHLRERIDVKESYSFKTNVSLVPGPNIFILELLDEKNAVIDRETLLLEMDGQEIREVDAFTLAPQQCLKMDSTTAASKRIISNDAVSENATVTNRLSSLTGSAVAYNAENNISLLPVLFGVIGILLLGIVLQHRH